MRKELSDRMAAREKQLEWNRAVYRLTDSLMIGLHIPHGQGLVAFLTNEPIRTNRDAIVCWVKKWLVENNREPKHDTLFELQRALHNHLTEIEFA